MPKIAKKKVRLPTHIRPSRYNITIKPDLEAFTFEGEEDIHIAVGKRSKSITLHSAELEILSVEYRTGKISIAGNVSYLDAEELATLTFTKNIPKGKGVLKISFTGILNDKMRGFYRSRYEHGGETYHMAVTQFESTDARRAFPSFDEPAHKAVFEVSLVVPEDRVAISNMLETETLEHSAGYKIVKFSPSPKMSSYLLAFIVGHFEHLKGKTKSGVLVRVFTTPGKKHQAAFALECTIKCIEFYEKYFGIRYPLPVMDLIAIPDFAAGAMENWGAVTYRETAVLVDPEHSALQNKQRVALVIAHELAHQWFGNLVTMEWWTHLWLNEGFATYMEYVAIHAVFPKWNIWAHFIAAEHMRALALDGLSNTHAIEIDVHHPQEISEIFDAVSYSKGASVIRMLATYLGENAFRKGLQNYLKKHQYGNALTLNLWRALEKASGKPVGTIMHNWTRKPGYPLISIQESSQELIISQQRFVPNRDPKNRDQTKWLVPLTLYAHESKAIQLLLKDKKIKLPFRAKGHFKANRGETSFIRVKYSAANLDLLSEAIAKKTKVLGEADRFGIVRDAFALAQSGASSTASALSLAGAYRHEESYIVWGEICDQLLRLRSLLFGKPMFDDFCAYGRELLKDAVQKTDWQEKKGESSDAVFLRSVLLRTSGALGDKSVIQKARELFRNGKEANSIDPSIRATVYFLVAENGGKAEFNALLSMYKKSTLEEEKDRILRALCSFKDEAILKEVLKTAFSKDSRGQDILKAVNFVWGNPYGRTLAWSHVKSNWEGIVKRFGGGHLFARFLLPAGNFTAVDEANDIQNFFKKNPSLGIERTVAQAIEQIRSNAAWYARDEENISLFLTRQKPR
jgi:puromycin-sensitive aminopeptidase